METRCRFSLCPAALAHHHHFHHHHHHHRCPIICPQHGHHNHHYHHHCQHRNITTAAAFPPAVAAGEATASEATNASSSFQEEADVDEILGADAEVYDDDADPVFVLTDEWKEFFAASEARRRLEKQQRQSKKNTKR